MKQLIEMIDKIQSYVNAVDTGFNKFLQVIPTVAKQHLQLLAQRKLDSTRDNYIQAIQAELSQYVMMITLDNDNWLANAVEQGVSSFNLKDGHLKSPMARTSKVGFRYMYIPIGLNQKVQPGKDSQANVDFQKKIRDVLQKPKFGIKKFKQGMDGSVASMEEVQTTDPDLGGIYRITTWTDAKSFASGKRGGTQYVMFRCMSEKPGTSVWQHPGIAPKNLFKDLNVFLGATAGKLLESMVNDEISKIK